MKCKKSYKLYKVKIVVHIELKIIYFYYWGQRGHKFKMAALHHPTQLLSIKTHMVQLILPGVHGHRVRSKP